jgi:ribose 5-phosphate isomerase RpiB
MIFTARQLEELHKSNGHVVLPYRARLTPMAQDWIRVRKIAVGYSDDGATRENSAKPQAAGEAKTVGGKFLWWCDGPCGPAKAALMAQAREADIGEIGAASDPQNLSSVIKELARVVKEKRSVGGILIVQYGAGAMVMANRCPSLRAVLGTCLEAVEQGMRQVGANVLVIEHPYKTLSQVKNMLARFVNGQRNVHDDVQRQLAEMASCG